MKLSTINALIGWTGFRLVVSAWDGKGEAADTRLSLVWWPAAQRRFVRTGSYLAIAAAVLLCFTPARAGDGSIEITVAQPTIDAGEDLDGTGIGYAVAYDQPFGKGRLSGRFNLERQDGFDNPDQGAWQLDASALVHFGDATTLDGDPAGRLRAYLGGSFAWSLMDRMTATEAVTVSDGETTLTGETEVEVGSQHFAVGGVAGARVYFDATRTIGMGVEARYFKPISDGVEIDGEASARVFLILPAEPVDPPASP
jgi:hypothetical protein